MFLKLAIKKAFFYLFLFFLHTKPYKRKLIGLFSSLYKQ